MAVGDLLRCQIIAEGRESEWSMTFHYQELTPANQGLVTKQLSEGLAEHITPTLRACLSNEHQVSRVKVDKVSGTPSPNNTFSLPIALRVGTQAGGALPSNSPVSLSLFQSVFGQASNGRFWMSGVPSNQVLGSVLLDAYALGVLSAFLNQLAVNVSEVSGGEGLWRIGVFSRKFLAENPGDFEGAFAALVATGFDPRIGRMRSRRFGGRRRTPKPPVPA